MQKIYFLGQYIRSAIQQLPQLDFVKITSSQKQGTQLSTKLRKFVLENSVTPSAEVELVATLQSMATSDSDDTDSHYRLNCEMARLPSL